MLHVLQAMDINSLPSMFCSYKDDFCDASTDALLWLDDILLAFNVIRLEGKEVCSKAYMQQLIGGSHE
jgi:hypothetical protein